MSKATGAARLWSESVARDAPRPTPHPPTASLIDAPRQSNRQTLLRATINAAIITSVATPDSHPDCRALLIRIVVPQSGPATVPSSGEIATGPCRKLCPHLLRQLIHGTHRETRQPKTF